MPDRVPFAMTFFVNAGNVSLIVATLDLKVVQLLRDAMNAGLPKTGPLGTIPPGANPATPRVHPKFDDSPRLKGPRPVLHPTPRFEPRPVYRLSPKFEDVPPQYLVGPEQSSMLAKSNPIKPVWRNLPPVKIEQVTIRPKVIVQKVDVIHKGTLLDFFI